jgi:hypothetical protein
MPGHYGDKPMPKKGEKEARQNDAPRHEKAPQKR